MPPPGIRAKDAAGPPSGEQEAAMPDEEEFNPQDMDDILDGNVVDEFNPKPGEVVGEEGKDQGGAEAKGEQGQDKGSEPPKEPTPPSEDDDLAGKETIPVKQALDERRKRQDAEKRTKELEDEIAKLRTQPQQQQQQPQQQRPDPYSDPDGAAAWDRAQADERDFELRCELTRDTWMDLKSDYEQKEAAFLEEVDKNPALRLSLRQSSNPAKFAYEQGSKLLLQREIGDDASAYRERIREEVRAEIEAEAQQQTTPQAKPKPRVPQSLAKETSAPVASKDESWDGPTPLDKVLPA
jgi:hypothetical protein